jgi:ATP-dependent DNA helicase RecG
MSIEIQKINALEFKKILALQESHFLDFKSIEIQPSKLTKSISAFANADGGELYIGIHEDKRNKELIWSGFKTIEDANGHLQVLNELFVLGEEYDCRFLFYGQLDSLVLHLNIQKTRGIKRASGGKACIRHGSQNLPVPDESVLRRNKGLESFESEVTPAALEDIISSEVMKNFIIEAVPNANPETFLRKQRLVYKEKVNVCGVLLFSDLPQAIIPKRCGIKIYRYKTESFEGKREVLDFVPMTVEGCVYSQIHEALIKTLEVVEALSYFDEGALVRVKYPPETLHEIITNAVLHRDYSMADDIHIRIYENRIEVESPGKLPGHITEKNILEERFSRNGNLVRIINKFPNPPNKDIGEGLNTAFREMQKFRLTEPVIKQEENRVVVYIYHQCLASLEDTILNILETELLVTSSIIRKAYYIENDHRLRKAFNKLLSAKLVEKVPGKKGAYQKVQQVNFLDAFSDSLRDYQIQAILNIEKALISGEKRAMVSFPPGTGLDNTSLALIYKILKDKKYRKIFYIVRDKSSQNKALGYLRALKIGKFEALSDEFEIQEIQRSHPIGDASIYVGTEQSFIGNLTNGVSDEGALDNSLIIMRLDNISDAYKTVLNSTTIPIVGFTFGSSENLDLFFEGNKVFSYTISQAVQDGYWVRPQYIELIRDPYRIFEDETAQSNTFSSQYFDRLVFEKLLDLIDVESPEKTIIFCKSIAHASLITSTLREIFISRYGISMASLVTQITSNLYPKEALRLTNQFQKEEQPKIAVTVDLLTSIDASKVCNLVFVRPVQSENLLLRMLGIAARPCPEIGKQSFRIFDAVGLLPVIENVFGREKNSLTTEKITSSA